MSEKILQQILTEIRDMKSDISDLKSDMTSVKSDMASVKSQFDENTQIIKSIPDRQRTVAKLENLTMDVHYLRGEFTRP